jgi:hypothetical protein
MDTIRDLYADSLDHKETLLGQIVELLVVEKKVLAWDEPLERIYDFITPPPGKKDAWNQRYREELKEMNEKKGRRLENA